MPHLIIFATLFFCALVASCVLTACQPLNQPFRPEDKPLDAPLLAVRDAGGLVVRPVAGLSEGGEALATAVANALERLEVPATATPQGVNRRTVFVDGAAQARPLPGGRLAVEIDWRLTDAEGHPVGVHRTTAEVRREAWDGAASRPQTYVLLGERAAPGIAALVQEPVQAAVTEPAASRRVYIWPVAGAPGDGGAALGRALGSALRAAEVPLAREMADDALVIAGAVHVAPPTQGRQRVEIVWTVLDSAGNELAKIAQANAVEAGALDGAWGELAGIIAQAAAPGVLDLLRQLPARAEAPAPPSGG